MEIREILAEYAHSAWSRWMKHQWKVMDASPKDSAVWWERWHRLASTDYFDLSEEEKASDRAEADKILALLEKVKWQDRNELFNRQGHE